MPIQFYCSRCGTPLAHVPPIACQGCHTAHWRNPKPCAGALVTHQGKLMLIRRARDPYQGDWDIPGGFLEFGEHPAEAARREVFEETGLEIQITGLLGLWMDEYGPEPVPELRDSTLNLYFLATLCNPAQERPDPAEVAEIGWFLPDQLPDNIAFPRHECQVLQAWQRARQCGFSSPPYWEDEKTIT